MNDLKVSQYFFASRTTISIPRWQVAVRGSSRHERRTRPTPPSMGCVKQEYERGHIVYERGLQGALYSALREAFPDRGIVVEPHWDDQIPDMAIVESGNITDIFELKFVPHWYPQFQPDIEKLLAYNGKQHVTLNPCTGRWAGCSPIRDDCRLHFVVVGQHDAAAVDPKNLLDRILLWYGRVGGQNEWDVSWGRQPLSRPLCLPPSSHSVPAVPADFGRRIG